MTRLCTSSPARRFLPTLAVFMALALGGCQEGSLTSGVSNILSFGTASETVVVKGTKVAQADLPWHLKSAVAATVLRVRGKDPAEIEAVLPVTGSGGIATDEAADLHLFGVQNILVNDFFHPDKAPDIYRLGARVIMVGPSGRRFAFSFVADYELSDDEQVVMKGHQWTYIRAASPGVETYLVPKSALDSLDEKTARDYIAFRSHVITNSLKAGGAEPFAPSADYAIVSFVLDRLVEGDGFELRISDVKESVRLLREGTDGFNEDSRYIIHDGGWVTAVIPGNFSLGSRKAFFIKAVYTPDTDSGGLISIGNKERLIGLFNTANITTDRTN